MNDLLFPLLHHLDSASMQNAHTWREWNITPVAGGSNNLIYRATNDDVDYAVKFTVRDERNRALREYKALCVIQQSVQQLAPRPVLLDQSRYHQPVVVQTWLEGQVLTEPPSTADVWSALIGHYCAIHSITPAQTHEVLPNAVLNVQSGKAGKALVHQHVAKIPRDMRPDSLKKLLAWFDSWTPPTWPTPPRTLCRVDANCLNFIRRGSGWASVDWENSGWGDPAFEIADWMSHPAYEDVPLKQWEQVIAEYAQQRQDFYVDLRIRTYYTIMLAWWVVRIARGLYEIPRGLDPRLVARPDNWQIEMEQKYQRFVHRAEAHVTRVDLNG